MEISITNLNRSASVQALRALFEPFGGVLTVSLLTDRYTGRSRGLGRIGMREQGGGERAIAALNNTSFMSQTITVREAVEPASFAPALQP